MSHQSARRLLAIEHGSRACFLEASHIARFPVTFYRAGTPGAQGRQHHHAVHARAASAAAGEYAARSIPRRVQHRLNGVERAAGQWCSRGYLPTLYYLLRFCIGAVVLEQGRN